jgi:hypothetical protein
MMDFQGLGNTAPRATEVLRVEIGKENSTVKGPGSAFSVFCEDYPHIKNSRAPTFDLCRIQIL